MKRVRGPVPGRAKAVESRPSVSPQGSQVRRRRTQRRASFIVTIVTGVLIVRGAWRSFRATETRLWVRVFVQCSENEVQSRRVITYAMRSVSETRYMKYDTPKV